MFNEQIDIILINYNNYVDTIDCIKSLDGVVYPHKRIIIVDNNSTNESVRELQKAVNGRKDIVLIALDKNLGFAGGNNIGIKRALENGVENILLLNNDTEVEPDFLQKLTKDWNKESVRTPRINYFYDKKTVWYAAGNFNTNKCKVENGEPDHNARVSFASGCCMLFSKKIIDRIGLMREDYFMYCEDVEYSLRMTKFGVPIEYIADSVIYHKVGKSSGGVKSKASIYYNNRNRFYLIKEYRLGTIAVLYTFVTRMLRLIRAAILHNNDAVIIRAYADYRHGIKGKCPNF